jgi:hypothetical protein
MILQLESALFQASQLQFVVAHVVGQKFDHRVQIAMFNFQLDDAPLYILVWFSEDRHYSPTMSQNNAKPVQTRYLLKLLLTSVYPYV